ncbi:hypothetical protein C8J57DRAFT_1464754 [Mycena rebaudengoi]|nr:hypothetical protein C8J57DRAFT_1464754 [Mycena rebaudengoi]
MKTLWPVGRLEVAQKCNDVLALSVVNHEGLVAAARQLRQKELGRIFWPVTGTWRATLPTPKAAPLPSKPKLSRPNQAVHPSCSAASPPVVVAVAPPPPPAEPEVDPEEMFRAREEAIRKKIEELAKNGNAPTQPTFWLISLQSISPNSSQLWEIRLPLGWAGVKAFRAPWQRHYVLHTHSSIPLAALPQRNNPRLICARIIFAASLVRRWPLTTFFQAWRVSIISGVHETHYATYHSVWTSLLRVRSSNSME